ncbi:MAG: threonylcarbamoyl-AMP synthase [Candidatus Magasanikbacteria bacterium]|nr:threonylcarbamoyl-AMP synthase [Candidatus Magasanikbacteria bacterium]
MRLIKKTETSIDELLELLRQGASMVYPTETCYGLGCDAGNQEAVNRIFEIKNRQKDKPLLVVASDPAMMAEYVDWSPALEEISRKYWPGPLTVVVPAKHSSSLANGVVASDGSLAFRITKHEFAAEISRRLGKPLVSTSANLASFENPYHIEDVIAMFQNQNLQPDIIIDAGELPYNSPSTVVRIRNGKAEIIRQGEIILEFV